MSEAQRSIIILLFMYPSPFGPRAWRPPPVGFPCLPGGTRGGAREPIWLLPRRPPGGASRHGAPGGKAEANLASDDAEYLPYTTKYGTNLYGQVSSHADELYVFNGFFMTVRNAANEPGKSIHYYMVE